MLQDCQNEPSLQENFQSSSNFNSDSLPTKPTTTEKYLYHFDDPLLQDSGYVLVINRNKSDCRIVIHFPTKNSTTDYVSENKLNKNIQLWINSQLQFSYNFLPILTWNDFSRCQDILYKGYLEWIQLSKPTETFSNAVYPGINHELSTDIHHPLFHLSCSENMLTTVLELHLEPTSSSQILIESSPNPEPCLQIQFGTYTVFCSQQNLTNLDPNTRHFLVSFLLCKLLGWFFFTEKNGPLTWLQDLSTAMPNHHWYNQSTPQ